jgi:hypothetical protein
MKRIYSIAMLVILASSTTAFLGCHSDNENSTADNGGKAGGNGAFGENPAHPGTYTGDPGTTPQTNPNNK